jgi:NADPH:quinone reductase-like Zn-dependent oxidoreductase/SAM-dependent methyltransferase
MAIEHFELRAPVDGPVWAHATVARNRDVVRAYIGVVSGESGAEIARLDGIELRLAKETTQGEDVFFAPAWEQSAARLRPLAKALSAAAAQAGEGSGMGSYPAVRRELDSLCSRSIVVALDKLGVRLAPGVRVTPGQVGVAQKHRMLLDRLLEILAEDGILCRAGDGAWVCQTQPERGDLDWVRLLASFPEFGAEIETAARCAPHLAEVLAGAADPLQLLFPGGSTELAERLYSNSPSARAYNGLIAQAVNVLSAGQGGKLRVLEIGGGTGGTSTFALPALPADRTEYTFTDISPLFAARAKERFAQYPFVDYRTLDIEQDPAQQGFDTGTYDLILASNVLHATTDLRRTMQNVRSLLSPAGILVLLEVTRPERWIDLTFGLTEGWWRFTDRELRPSYALLPVSSWKELLAQTGFAETAEVSVPGDTLNAILMARAAPEAIAPGSWMIAGPESEFSLSLAAALEARGTKLARAASEATAGIVYTAAVGTLDPRSICEPLLDLLRSSSAPRLCLVTAGAAMEVTDPEGATLWGIGRTVSKERPEVRCTCVDLDPAAPDPEDLASEVLFPDGETEIAYRGGVRHVNRLRRASLRQARFRLAVEKRGTLDNLRLEPAARRLPGRGQIEIEVDAAAIGFRDVLNVLGMYPGDPGPLGAECAGRVAAVGAEVAGFAPGDAVIALAPGAHDGYVLADAALVARQPQNLSIEEAITLPVPFVTAIYTLEHLAEIKRGERVLIHSAAGGVGLAAVHIASRAGAEIFATAGSEEKREMLRSLGVAHVLDSRSTEFRDYIEEATGGRGVDIVLNSLAGEAMDASFSATARGGRFLEIGKSGIRTPEEIAALGKEIRYFVVDWSEEIGRNTELIGSTLRRIMDTGLPPLPRTVFPFADAVSAYRFMAQARHTGRIILRQPGVPVHIRPHLTYVIAGGHKGLGFEVAKWLVDNGATDLLLLGRNADKVGIEGANVRTAAVDIASRDAVESVLAGMPPVAGVINSAGTLDDAMLADQSWERFERLFRAKVEGAVNLYEAVAGTQLDFFVLFSSIASLLGAPGQANHAAANAFEDAYAHALRRRGVPAICINWGAWSGTGSADRAGLQQRRSTLGLEAFTIDEGLAIFERILRAGPVQVGAARMDWHRYATRYPATPAVEPLLAPAPGAAPKRPANTAVAAAPAEVKPAAPSLVEQVEAATPAGRPKVIESYVQQVASRILGLPAGRRIDGRQPLQELGLDSLMAVEFRNSLSAAIGRTLPVTLLFSYPAVDDVTRFLTAELLGKSERAAAANASSSSIIDGVEELSDEDVDRLLAAKLGGRP